MINKKEAPARTQRVAPAPSTWTTTVHTDRTDRTDHGTTPPCHTTQQRTDKPYPLYTLAARRKPKSICISPVHDVHYMHYDQHRTTSVLDVPITRCWHAAIPGMLLTGGKPMQWTPTTQRAAENAVDETGLCPVCGESVHIVGLTTDGRIYATCKDAFTLAQWQAPDE